MTLWTLRVDVTMVCKGPTNSSNKVIEIKNETSWDKEELVKSYDELMLKLKDEIKERELELEKEADDFILKDENSSQTEEIESEISLDLIDKKLYVIQKERTEFAKILDELRKENPIIDQDLHKKKKIL